MTISDFRGTCAEHEPRCGRTGTRTPVRENGTRTPVRENGSDPAKERGEQVDSKAIKKHENDVFRLYQIITPLSEPPPAQVQHELSDSINQVKAEGPRRQLQMRISDN